MESAPFRPSGAFDGDHSPLSSDDDLYSNSTSKKKKKLKKQSTGSIAERSMREGQHYIKSLYNAVFEEGTDI